MDTFISPFDLDAPELHKYIYTFILIFVHIRNPRILCLGSYFDTYPKYIDLHPHIDVLQTPQLRKWPDQNKVYFIS